MKADLTSAPSFAMGGLTLRPFAGENLMVVRVEGDTGAISASHAHPHEQITILERGALRFTLGGQTFDVRPGEVVHVPSDVQHEAVLLERSTFYDVFYPPREDFLRKVEENAEPAG
jgi:quercetin dioxygenase-like cupin family protein